MTIQTTTLFSSEALLTQSATKRWLAITHLMLFLQMDMMHLVISCSTTCAGNFLFFNLLNICIADCQWWFCLKKNNGNLSEKEWKMSFFWCSVNKKTCMCALFFFLLFTNVSHGLLADSLPHFWFPLWFRCRWVCTSSLTSLKCHTGLMLWWVHSSADDCEEDKCLSLLTDAFGLHKLGAPLTFWSDYNVFMFIYRKRSQTGKLKVSMKLVWCRL